MFNRPRIIPVLLIDDGNLIKTMNFSKPVYLGDPINAVKIFNRKEIDELSILDISVTRKGLEPDFELLEDIASQAFMPLSYGGGIKTVDQVRKLLTIGYEKVVINTEYVKNPEAVREIIKFVGSQSVVISIDTKEVNGECKCVVSDGNEIINIAPIALARKAEQLGAGEIFLNSVDRDGMMHGYNINLIKSVSEAVNIPVTACGGAGCIADLRKVLQDGKAHAAAGGSMFVFYGRLKAVLITFPTECELKNAGIYQ